MKSKKTKGYKPQTKSICDSSDKNNSFKLIGILVFKVRHGMEVTKTTKLLSFKQEPFCYEKEDKNTKAGAETAQKKRKKTFLKKLMFIWKNDRFFEKSKTYKS